MNSVRILLLLEKKNFAILYKDGKGCAAIFYRIDRGFLVFESGWTTYKSATADSI